jgi:hypothetical protein
MDQHSHSFTSIVEIVSDITLLPLFKGSQEQIYSNILHVAMCSHLERRNVDNTLWASPTCMCIYLGLISTSSHSPYPSSNWCSIPARVLRHIIFDCQKPDQISFIICWEIYKLSRHCIYVAIRLITIPSVRWMSLRRKELVDLSLNLNSRALWSTHMIIS